MKNLILFLILICTYSLDSSAQATEITRQMNLGVRPGILVSLPSFDAKFIDKVWKKYTKSYGKVAKIKKSDEMVIEDAEISSIRGEKMNVYTSTSDGEFIAFFDVRNGFLNSVDHPKEFRSALEFMTEFGYEVQRERVREELEDENDKLKKSIKNLDKLKKDNAGYRQDIEEAEQDIKKARENIVTNEKEQIKADAEINSQRSIVEKVQEKLNKIGKSK